MDSTELGSSWFEFYTQKNDCYQVMATPTTLPMPKVTVAASPPANNILKLPQIVLRPELAATVPPTVANASALNAALSINANDPELAM